MPDIQLGELLSSAAAPLVAPLCLDPLTAAIAQRAGFQAGYVSGGALGYSYGVSEALLTLNELADVTRRITQHSSLPVIVDAGVGFGDPVHVTRAVRELEQAGAAAIELEDQVAPKRVSHHRGIEHLVPRAAMVDKVAHAAAARRSNSLLIIARTGAVKNESFAQALERLQAYHQAGADLLMLMPEDEQQISAARRELSAPLATITAMDVAAAPRWRDSGWQLVIDPFTAQVLSVQAVQQAYQNYLQTGSSGADVKQLFELYHQLDELAGLQPLYDIEDQTTEKVSHVQKHQDPV